MHFGEAKVRINLSTVPASRLCFSVQWEDARLCLLLCTVSSPAPPMETTTVRHASTAVTEATSFREYPAASACSAATGTESPPAANVSGLAELSSSRARPPGNAAITTRCACSAADQNRREDARCPPGSVLRKEETADPVGAQHVGSRLPAAEHHDTSEALAGSHLPPKTSTYSDPLFVLLFRSPSAGWTCDASRWSSSWARRHRRRVALKKVCWSLRSSRVSGISSITYAAVLWQIVGAIVCLINTSGWITGENCIL